MREGIACGVILPTEDLFYRKNYGQKVKIKPILLQASYQKILTKLIKGKSVVNHSGQKDLSHAELGRLVNSAAIESSPRPSFVSVESVENPSSNELISKVANPDIETSTLSHPDIESSMLDHDSSSSPVPGSSKENQLLPVEAGNILSELLNSSQSASVVNLPNEQAIQCLEELTVDEERLNLLMSVPPVPANFFTQVESETRSYL